MLIVRSDQCQATDAGGGAAIHFQPARPIVAPHGTRLLISLRQCTYSKSIANVTQSNNQISFKYDDERAKALKDLESHSWLNAESC